MDLKTAKPFKTYEEQIELLKSRGLTIKDEWFARHVLQYMSYYDLINGYKNVLMPNDKFIRGVTIEYLYQLYIIDKRFQSLSIKYSMIIENICKTNLAYILSEDFGIEQLQYLDQRNYKSAASDLLFTDDIQDKISNLTSNENLGNPCKHYKKKYNDIPPWILFKNIPFSIATNFVKFLKRPQKEKFVNALLKTDELDYSNKVCFITPALEIIRKFRNVAAHNLNFVMFRVDSINYPASLYATLMPDLIRTIDGKIYQQDRDSLKGLYNYILSVLILLPSYSLKSNFIDDFRLCIYNPYNKADNDKNLLIFEDYIRLTQLPKNILKRLNDYYITINSEF